MTRGLGGHSPANVTFYLKGIDFPAQKQNLLEHAKRNNAEPEVLETIESMPGEEFQSMADVMKAYGKSDKGGAAGRGEQGGNRSESSQGQQQNQQETRQRRKA